MVYTWTGAPALGFDLSRTPGGGAVADALGVLLRASAGDVAELAVAPGVGAPARRRALDRVRGRARRTPAALDVTDSLLLDAARARHGIERRDPHLPDLNDLQALVAWATTPDPAPSPDVPHTPRTGGPEDLIALVRREGFAAHDGDDTAAAAERIEEAVLAALLRPAEDPADGLPPDLVGLGVPVASLLERLPPPDFGPATADVARLTDRLRRRDEVIAERLADRLAGRPTGASGEWARAMHAVAWAVELTGRTVPAALAQLALVPALHDGGWTPQDCARGAWNIASGAVAALVVEDLLPRAERRVLGVL